MTDEQRQRIHDITYSTDDREELAERIVALEDENAKLKNNSNYLHEMLSESRQANEHLYIGLKRYKSILRTRPNAMTALYDENAKLRELVRDMWHDIPKSESCGWNMSTNTCTGSDECIGECSYWYRMHELGIEVE